MLGSFRIRMLAVIIIIFLVGICIESSQSSKKIVEPVIRYVLKDYGFDKKLSLFIENMNPASDKTVPVNSSSILQLPCKFSAVERNYGWYYNEEQEKQEFLPGVYLKVENNTAVKPIMAGEIEEIGKNEEGRTVMIKHNDECYSLYGGLKEVLVEQNSQVDNNSVLGKSGNLLYLEIRNNDGPVNPYNLINVPT
ncbi:MAG: M23 family metallopeptidase [Syntrophomonadaceae bacterium]|nr:M23 family metallopeptidase [Syntrophomonadaceae bacterium]